MLSLLIKKQFFESFKSLFINTKNGKIKSKKSRTLTIVLFVFVFFSLGFSFFGMSMIILPILDSKYPWLYYSIFGIMAFIFGIVLSSLQTSSYLFQAKDNEELLSMPIKPDYILLSRIITIYVINLLYISCLWLGISINSLIASFSVIKLLFNILLLFIITAFITMISCVIGYGFAYILKKTRSRAIISLIFSLFILAIYYFFNFKLEQIMTSFITNAASISANIKSKAFLFYLLGKAGIGDVLSLLLFTSIAAFISYIIFAVLSKKFIGIVTKSDKVKKQTKEIKYSKGINYKKSLLKREFNRFGSSAAYMMNCGLGSLFVIALAIGCIVKADDINEITLLINNDIVEHKPFVSLTCLCSVLLIMSINCISTPSISLEGKNLWILKSLPVKPYDIFEAKKNLHIIVNGVPSLIAYIIMGVILNIDFNLLIMIIVAAYLFFEIQANIGLIFGILRPNFNWTNETQPIKQSLNVLFVMLIGWIIVCLIGVLYYLLRDKLLLDSYLMIVVFVMMAIVVLLRRWLNNAGSIKFYHL